MLDAPFVMRLEVNADKVVNREPDLQIILNDNPNELQDTRMMGAADVVIEIVSPESVEQDYAIKFREYEAGGVREYWIINPLKSEALFYRLQDSNYQLQEVSDVYATPILPKFRLIVAHLWDEIVINDPTALVEQVKEMLATD